MSKILTIFSYFSQAEKPSSLTTLLPQKSCQSSFELERIIWEMFPRPWENWIFGTIRLVDFIEIHVKGLSNWTRLQFEEESGSADRSLAYESLNVFNNFCIVIYRHMLKIVCPLVSKLTYRV